MKNSIKWIVLIPMFLISNIIINFIFNIIYNGLEFIYNNFIGGNATYVITLEKYADDNIIMILFKSLIYAFSFNIACSVTSALLFKSSSKSILILCIFSFISSIFFLIFKHISYVEFFLYLLVLIGCLLEVYKVKK